MPESSGESNDGKSIWRITARESDILFYELLHTIELTGRRSFVKLQYRAASYQQIADFRSAVVDCRQNRRLPLFVLRACERGVGIEQGAHDRGIPCANTCEQFLGFVHRRLLRVLRRNCTCRWRTVFFNLANLRLGTEWKEQIRGMRDRLGDPLPLKWPTTLRPMWQLA